MRTVRNVNALPEDPDWCGHPFASLRTWTCATCDRPLRMATRARLREAPTTAPEGAVWILESAIQDGKDLPDRERFVEGVFSDRAKIARALVRAYIVSADEFRSLMRRTHWYQGVFNDMLFEGWAEEPNEQGQFEMYRLSVRLIDRV